MRFVRKLLLCCLLALLALPLCAQDLAPRAYVIAPVDANAITLAWAFFNGGLKASYSNGTYIRFGGNYQALQIAWQYSWLGSP
jgi:hypothetical protein